MEIFILSVLVLLNGFFALSEIALVSSKKPRLEHLRQKKKAGAAIAINLKANSATFLSAIQVGITLIGIVTGVYGGLAIAEDIAPIFERFPMVQIYADEIALVLTVVLITYFSIVIGELVPKTFALSNPERIAVIVSPVIYHFSNILFPFVRVLSVSTNLISRFFGVKKHSEQLTEIELIQLLKVASSEGVIEKEQNKMHEKVFFFSDKKAKHIMTHRTDVEWINLNDDPEVLKQKLYTFHHSKIVCCYDDLDNFVGILNVKDFFRVRSTTAFFELKSLFVNPIIAPENASAQRVLSLMKQQKNQFCCVVNEYGGFEGIITLHDILENIVGDIPEEDETYEPDMYVRDDKSILVNGEAQVEILTEIIEDFSVDFETTDYSTISGFVYDNLNKVPQIGDSFYFMGYHFEIVDVDGKKVDKVLISKRTQV